MKRKQKQRLTLRQHRETVLRKTIQEIADTADLAISTIHILERGWRLPMGKRLPKLARAYRVSETELVLMFGKKK